MLALGSVTLGTVAGYSPTTTKSGIAIGTGWTLPSVTLSLSAESERGEVLGGDVPACCAGAVGTPACCAGVVGSSATWGYVQRYPNVPPVTVRMSPTVAVRDRMLM